MAEIIWVEPALLDLDEIADYIARDKYSAAQKLVRKVFSTIERLEQFPLSGRLIPELSNTRYREIIVGPCRIFYRVEQNTVYILHVMRGERQLRSYLLDQRLDHLEPE